MKKILAFAIICAIAMTSIFSTDPPNTSEPSSTGGDYRGNIIIGSSITEVPLTLLLRYNKDELSNEDSLVPNGITNGAEYLIDGFNLTEDGQTKNFSLTATCNSVGGYKVNVKVEPEAFYEMLTDEFGIKYQNDVASPITPTVNIDDSVTISVISEGYHYKLLLNQFNLSWNGATDELTAGDYESLVYVTYSLDALK